MGPEARPTSPTSQAASLGGALKGQATAGGPAAARDPRDAEGRGPASLAPSTGRPHPAPVSHRPHSAALRLDGEVDDELRDIKREIVESRGLVIKTNNLTNALAADLKSISKRQMSFERRAFWNSASANLLFVVVVIGVVKLAWDARIDVVEADTRGAKEKATKLEGDLKAEQKSNDDRLRAESAAAAFYELLRSGRRQEAVEGFEALRKEPLSRAELAFFTDEVDKAKGELSVRAYQLGLDHIRMGRWHEAATALEDCLKYKEAAAHSPAAKLALAKAYRKLGRQREGIPLLLSLSEASPDREVMDDAMFLLAECMIDTQAYNDAKATLRQFIRRFPDSPFINDARMALADISIKH